jgi:Thioredoxin like C-terminal domain
MFAMTEHFVSPGGAVEDNSHNYTVTPPRLNEWGLSGDWTIGKEYAVLNKEGGSIVYRFHARDLHLVLGPVRVRVTIDGAPPGASHGADADADGQGVVTRQRLYQLVRQSGAIGDRKFEIQFLDPGVQAYAFTFG